MKNLIFALVFISSAAFAGNCDVTIPVHAQEDVIQVLVKHHYTPVYTPSATELTIRDLSPRPPSRWASFRISLYRVDAHHPAPGQKIASGAARLRTIRRDFGGLTHRWLLKGVAMNKAETYQKALLEFDAQLAKKHECI